MVIPRLLTPVSECFPTLVSSLQMRNERQLIDLIKSTTYQNLYCALWCTCQLPPRHGRSRIQSAIHTRLFRENEQDIGEPGTPNSTANPWWWLCSHTEIFLGNLQVGNWKEFMPSCVHTNSFQPKCITCKRLVRWSEDGVVVLSRTLSIQSLSCRFTSSFEDRLAMVPTVSLIFSFLTIKGP